MGGVTSVIPPFHCEVYMGELRSISKHDEVFQGHHIHVSFNQRTRTWMWWTWAMQRVDGEATTRQQAINDARTWIRDNGHTNPPPIAAGDD